MTYAQVVSEIYRMSPAERLSLITIIHESLDGVDGTGKLSLLDLEGVGAEVWQGVDAQDYINTLRQEWDEPS